ncbi:hypothetical protein DSO57_1015495 [Entomophthora muscae]|uniref:Uncharacterized protein n=1 Tax=Entomophthora muscae TaxID=34485 RepID=A0ACC2UF76_9FUNG|nr:hypothetical protein DSO57_1015495 [Entomophthora muscae]
MQEQLFWWGCKPEDASQDQDVLDNVVHQAVSRGTFFPSRESLALSIPRRTPSKSSTDTSVTVHMFGGLQAGLMLAKQKFGCLLQVEA